MTDSGDLAAAPDILDSSANREDLESLDARSDQIRPRGNKKAHASKVAECSPEECSNWLSALKEENRKLKQRIKALEDSQKAATSTEADVAGRKAPNGCLTAAYGFVGSRVRPKDAAKAEVWGAEAAPAALKPVEGGGAEWESQPTVGFKPIGYMESCFLDKNGTPRQGNVVPASKARLRILFGSNPSHTLLGLEHFSHVWVLFIFHDNGNKAVKAMVHPPRLDGDRKGLFATRTPHRPNPIGLSLCKLDGVDNDTVLLSGVDIIHGSPVIDIKPYIPFADSAPPADINLPEWMSADHQVPELRVRFLEEAIKQLKDLEGSLSLFSDANQAMESIRDVLKGDPRSVHLRKTADFSLAAGKRFVFAIDSVDVHCAFDGLDATVCEIVPVYMKLRQELQRALAADGAAAAAAAPITAVDSDGAAAAAAGPTGTSAAADGDGRSAAAQAAPTAAAADDAAAEP